MLLSSDCCASINFEPAWPGHVIGSLCLKVNGQQASISISCLQDTLEIGDHNKIKYHDTIDLQQCDGVVYEFMLSYRIKFKLVLWSTVGKNSLKILSNISDNTVRCLEKENLSGVQSQIIIFSNLSGGADALCCSGCVSFLTMGISGFGCNYTAAKRHIQTEQPAPAGPTLCPQCCMFSFLRVSHHRGRETKMSDL